jgi:hypothetical protein
LIKKEYIKINTILGDIMKNYKKVFVIIFIIILLFTVNYAYTKYRFKNRPLISEQFSPKTAFIVDNTQDKSYTKRSKSSDEIQPVIDFIRKTKLDEVILIPDKGNCTYEIILISTDAEVIRIYIYDNSLMAIIYSHVKSEDNKYEDYKKDFLIIDDSFDKHDFNMLFQNFDEYIQ